jgi:hypothetical protein
MPRSPVRGVLSFVWRGKRTNPLRDGIEIDVFDLPLPYPLLLSDVAELLRLRE